MFGGTLTKSITINDIKIELYDLEGVSYADWNNNGIYIILIQQVVKKI